MLVLLIFFLSHFFSAIAFAQSDGNTSVSDWIQQQNNDIQENQGEVDQNSSLVETDGNRVGIGVWDVIKSIFALLFVLFLLTIVLKWLQRKNRQFPSSQTIRSIAGISLGGNRSLQIVKIGSKLYVIGVGENIELIKEIEEKLEIEEILKFDNNGTTQFDKNNHYLKSMIDRINQIFQKKTSNPTFKQEMEHQFNQMLNKRKEVMEDKLERGTNDE